MTTFESEVVACRESALSWLCNSAIRSSDGAYRSIYDPVKRSCDDWCGHETCLLSTAGAVTVLREAGLDELSRRSADYVCSLALSEGPFAGAFEAGAGSARIYTNWVLSAVLALLGAGQRFGTPRYVEVAESAGRFVIQHAQQSDGSIFPELAIDGSRGFRNRIQPRQIWAANCVESFAVLEDATGDDVFAKASEAFQRWLLPLQRPNGSFPMYQVSALGRVASGLNNRSPSELFRGCRRGHPTSHTHAMKALLLAGRLDEARQIARWLERHFGVSGLLHQFYYPGGRRSVEEDVMPTAHFGLIALEHPELGVSEDTLVQVARGIMYSQIESDDPDANGGLRGLPLHPEEGERAYCWDTIYGIRFLMAR